MVLATVSVVTPDVVEVVATTGAPRAVLELATKRPEFTVMVPVMVLPPTVNGTPLAVAVAAAADSPGYRFHYRNVARGIRVAGVAVASWVQPFRHNFNS